MDCLTGQDDLPAGQRFGSYVVHACIGRGGTARLYRAEHMGLGKAVALKILDREKLDSSQWRRRFVLEGQAAAAVKHPNIVDVTDVGVENGLPFLVMEYLEGQDLAARLEAGGRFSEQEMADLMLPVIAGLGFAHDRGVVHRDIKPSNIFLARQPDGGMIPKLLDFGIAKSNGLATEHTDVEQTDTQQVVGTPMFLPPEAFEGSRYVTARSDQYSLGLLMFQCLTGRRPFEQRTPASLLVAIAAGRRQPLRQHCPTLSAELERVVERATQLDPEARFSHVREMGKALLPLASQRSQVLWADTFQGAPLHSPDHAASSAPPPPLSATQKLPERGSLDVNEAGQRARPPRLAMAALVGLAFVTATAALSVWSSRRPTAAVPNATDDTRSATTRALQPQAASSQPTSERQGATDPQPAAPTGPAASAPPAVVPPPAPTSPPPAPRTPSTARSPRHSAATARAGERSQREKAELRELFPAALRPSAPEARPASVVAPLPE